jgi:hypothetical protein
MDTSDQTPVPGDDQLIQRAIVLQLLEGNHESGRTRTELEGELRNIPPLDVNEALQNLENEGVLRAAGETILLSPCVWCLDGLGLVSV